MIDKALSIVFALVLAAAGVWWFYDDIGDHFRAPLIAEYKETQRLQKKQNELAASSLKVSNQATKTVYIDRIKEIEVYAKNLPIDSACRADAEFIRLLNNR